MVGKVERAIRFSVKPEIAPAQETTRTPAEAAESEAPSGRLLFAGLPINEPFRRRRCT